MTVKIFLKNNFYILLSYLLLVVTALFIVITYDKLRVHLYLNQFVGKKALNLFFYYITFLGDGLVALVLLLLILFSNVRLGVYATLSFLSASIVAQILKHYFFDDVNRPKYVFETINQAQLQFVNGVDNHIHNSFPSGHATQAFAIFMCLVFFTRKSYLKWLFFLIAVLSAYSRVYLSQHWLNDVLAGSVIGAFFSITFYLLIWPKNRLSALNSSLFTIKRTHAARKEQ